MVVSIRASINSIQAIALAIRSPLLDPPDIVSGALSGSRFWAVGDDHLSHPPAELYQPIAFSRDTSANLAALAIPPPGMGTALGELNAPPPLNARRPAAPTLPSFELPPPNFQINVGAPKYPLQSNAHHPTHPSVSSLLTPPASTQAGEVTAPTTAAPTTAVSASPDVTPSYGTAYWAGHSGYGGTPGAAPRWSAGTNQSYPTRDSFSPSTLHPLSRNPPTSPPVTEGMAQYDMHHLPPFQQSLSVPPSGLPSAPQHPAMTHTMLASPGLPNPGPSPHLLPSNDHYAKSQSALVYSPHQASFPAYGQPGLGIHPPNRVSSNATLATGPPPHLSYSRQPWPSYSLPAMNGPVMTNIHSPNSQMSLLGSMQPGILPGFNSGHVASMQQMYGGHPPHPLHQPGPTNDRPFKCDQCPQSFNRNHDLKRHKRIHLSVKPFPCTHCDKSFSRKDALKRHILVKGCGKDGSDSNKTSSVKEEDKESVDTNGSAFSPNNPPSTQSTTSQSPRFHPPTSAPQPSPPLNPLAPKNPPHQHHSLRRDWWYFDAISSSNPNVSLAITLFTSTQSAFPFLSPSSSSTTTTTTTTGLRGGIPATVTANANAAGGGTQGLWTGRSASISWSGSEDGVYKVGIESDDEVDGLGVIGMRVDSGRGRVAPYSIVWFDFLPVGNEEVASGYVAVGREVIVSGCEEGVVSVQPTRNGNPPVPGDVPDGFRVVYSMGMEVDVTLGAMMAGDGEHYLRWTGTKSAEMDGKVYEGTE
ncbi:hypothetical protein CNMCM5793_001016 [Aspergillus hiratsukae]|uniref:C2H2-type domain-containing protein n=1 Tax=Aspergillus hiratsukae TaxID=1194566 RepID=A0A8H6Q1E3_9EURO|nr:hypothetical protein CNMCM5793_001016 [Aspergillus hiratsukae]KAF7163806.1 hypothetical protein CNMCM6106_000569 [Aspergillus hiratsukae]